MEAKGGKDHLPLTKALRGTQLLNNLLTHLAFADMEDKEVDKEEEAQE